MSDNFEMFGEMFKAQQQAMENWMKAFAPMQGSANPFNVYSFPGMPNMAQMNEWMQQQQKLYAPWMEAWKAFQPNADATTPFTAWQEAMKSYNPLAAMESMTKTTSDVYQKMMDSRSFYLGLYDVWNRINESILEPSEEHMKEQSQEFLQKYDDFVLNNFLPLLPEQLRPLFSNPYEFLKSLNATATSFYTPLGEATKEMAKIVSEATFKDPTKLTDALQTWKKIYDKGLGAMLKAPVVGSSREAVEQFNRSVDSLIEFVSVAAEYAIKVYNLTNDNSKKALEKYVEMVKQGGEAKTFNEFYKFWSGSVEGELEKYFYTDEFAQLISKIADAAMKYKIESDKVLEKVLENSPIVTNNEIDNVYKNVYLLKKEVRALKKELAELKAPEQKKEEKAK